MKTYFNLKGFFNMNQNLTSESAEMTPHEMILADIKKTQNALEVAYSGFDNVTDPDLIDCYIYEVNSALKRYRFLLQQAQNMQLCESYEQQEASPLTEHKLVSQLCPIPNSLSLNHN